MNDAWIPAIDLVPHRPPMLLVDSVRLTGDGGERESALARSLVKPEWPVLDASGLVMESALFEVAAQSFAAMAGLRLRESGEGAERRLGFLVALKRFNILGTAGVGDELVTSVDIVASLGEFSVVQCHVRHAERLLAEGQLKVYCPTVDEVEKMLGA